jgi:hypothetical protein
MRWAMKSCRPCRVLYDGASGPVMVRADDYSLEDVVTYVLHNAERYRTPPPPSRCA